MTDVWDELLGQPEAIELIKRAVSEKSQGVHHAWLFTGPAGSGRSLMARAFAAALQCNQDGCGNCQQCNLSLANAHPDVNMLATERVQISIEEVRALVAKSTLSSAIGEYRIAIIEDADRMTERTSNVLLKALEEPESKTIWMLCAPSVADLLPTIRSRTRNVVLRMPSDREVAQLLVQRDGVSMDQGLIAARQAQNHVGMARRLALSQEARARRSETLREIIGISNLSRAMVAAEHLLSVAKRDAQSLSEERDAKERSNLLRAYGLSEEDKLPPNLRAEFKALEENQKRRNTRALRDGIDRIFTDAESLFRDIMAIQLDASVDLINPEVQAALEERAASSTVQNTVAVLDAIAEARLRLAANVRDLLVLEALCTRFISRSSVAA